MVGGFGSVTERFWPAVLIKTDGSKMLFTAADANISFHPYFPSHIPTQLPVISNSSYAQIPMLSQCALLGTSGRLSGGDPEEVNPAATVTHK